MGVLQYSLRTQQCTSACCESMSKLQYVALSASSLLVWTAGCIYREISGLPLAQWAPLVLGLSLSRQAGELLSKQLFHSAPVTGRPSKRTERMRSEEQREGKVHMRTHNDIMILMSHLLNKCRWPPQDDQRLSGRSCH